ncbi:hypothetical protein RF11_01470 [Thelohanellus kitauei]|uniref:Uncharacterized protein n=1 Tax=Thelohanellus kitauei TaxID=669202 RepID=A0A0C2MK18_THEKT|nr:hypothetical protein RF11_01470 [Thelohanellus kitauei]
MVAFHLVSHIVCLVIGVKMMKDLNEYFENAKKKNIKSYHDQHKLSDTITKMILKITIGVFALNLPLNIFNIWIEIADETRVSGYTILWGNITHVISDAYILYAACSSEKRIKKNTISIVKTFFTNW